ncbi:MAG: methionyl-tRNA formyltransferase [Desulfobacterales bacterium]|nr:methionyl-tRNA formyltransferase [Desulfobacterales bacterium]
MRGQNRNRVDFPVRPKIIFMGTPDFAVVALKALVKHGHNVLAVVTQPDRPGGRGRKVLPSPVKQIALECQMEVLQSENVSDEHFCDIIRGKTPDLLIIVAFGQILRKNLLDIPKWGTLNVHASLLPKYRGAAPIHWAILNNETKTGLTAMRMDEGLDTGPVLLQEEVAIHTDETTGELHDRLAGLSGEFLQKTLQGLAENRLTEQSQDETQSVYAPKIDRHMSFVEWARPAQSISALIRALDPRPGAYTTLRGKEIKLFSSSVKDEERVDVIPGRVAGYFEGALEVETGKGLVRIREMQISGKKRLTANDFIRGFPLDKGTILG